MAHSKELERALDEIEAANGAIHAAQTRTELHEAVSRMKTASDRAEYLLSLELVLGMMGRSHYAKRR